MLFFHYITIFPDCFHNYFNYSIAKKALEKKKINYRTYNIRDYSEKGKVDDYVYGGGPGMLLKIEPIVNVIDQIKKENASCYFILLSPQGKRFKQKNVDKLIKKKNLILICGHYEGIDARISNFVDEEISIGDFITSGGEIPALLMTDVLVRMVPGVINEQSLEKESFNKSRFDYDSFTRPEEFRELVVPKILLSGNHKEIEKWREKNILQKQSKVNKNKKR